MNIGIIYRNEYLSRYAGVMSSHVDSISLPANFCGWGNMKAYENAEELLLDNSSINKSSKTSQVEPKAEVSPSNQGIAYIESMNQVGGWWAVRGKDKGGKRVNLAAFYWLHMLRPTASHWLNISFVLPSLSSRTPESQISIWPGHNSGSPSDLDAVLSVTGTGNGSSCASYWGKQWMMRPGYPGNTLTCPIHQH